MLNLVFFIHLTTGTTRVGWAVKPVFCIELHIKDLELIKAIQNYFGVGIIQINKKRNTVYFSVQSVKDVVNSVIPHFDKYPLITKKRADYLLWKMVVLMIANKEHLTLDGILKIMAIRASINKGLSPKLVETFPNVIPVSRPIVEDQKIRNPYWLAGFTEGEGCFLIRIQNSSAYKLGSQVKLVFTLAQHSRDEILVKSFVEYFGPPAGAGRPPRGRLWKLL